MKDDLNDLLRSWDPAPPEPRDFRRNVWLRIEAGSERKPVVNWFERFFSALARPRVALPAAVAVVFASLLIGQSLAAGDGREAYLRTVNPYARMASIDR